MGLWLVDILLSICVMELLTVLMVMMRILDCVLQVSVLVTNCITIMISPTQQDVLLWRKPPASWSLCWPLMVLTIWRNSLDQKLGTTCSLSVGWTRSPSLSQVCYDINLTVTLTNSENIPFFRISDYWGIWWQDGSSQNWCWAPQVCVHGCGEWRYWDAEISGH